MLSDSEISAVGAEPIEPIVRADPDKLGLRRRKFALFVTLIGLATFVTPFISTDTEILGHTRWSQLQIVLALGAGTLPVVHSPSTGPLALGFTLLFGIGGIYLLLCVIATAIIFIPSVRVIGSSAFLGALLVCGWFTGGKSGRPYFDIEDVFYGRGYFLPQCHVHAGTLCLILAVMFGVLFFIAATKQLDY